MNRDELRKELVKDYKEDTSGIFLLAPRFGKSRLAIDLIKDIKADSILWVTPFGDLRDKDIPDEFIKWRAKSYLKKLNVITYASLHKEIGKYKLIILDEPQFVTENNCKTLLNGKLKGDAIIGLTGTMPEHEEKLEIFKKLKMPVLHELTIDEAVEHNILADYKVNVIECNLDNTTRNIEAGAKGKKFKTTEAGNYGYVDNMVKRMMYSSTRNPKAMQFVILKRMRAVYDSPTKEAIGDKLFKKLKSRKLIFCSSIDQAERLSKNTFHSKTNNEDLNKFLEEKIDTLACVNAGGIGKTFRNVDHFIIIQANSNKRGDITQKIARSLLQQGKDYKANIWIISLLGTQDETWVENALKTFDKTKINFINVKNLDNYANI